jgi:hypothetical protein
VKRSRWAIIRNTYGQLRDTTQKTFEQWVPERLGDPAYGTGSGWEEQAFTWHGRWSDGKNVIECEVLFRALDRPADVRKLLSLELTGAYINEAREVAKSVLDVLQSRVGRYPSKAQGGPTWFGIWMDTNPWAKQHWGYKLFTLHKDVPADQRHLYELFEQPGGRTAQAENVENLPPGYYDRLVAGKDSEYVESYVDGKYPANDQGAIFGSLIEALELRGGLGEFDHPLDGVFTTWDLGVSDSTAIWFWRITSEPLPARDVLLEMQRAGKVWVARPRFDFIDHYEASGHGASHYFGVVDAKPYKYLKHWLPHDARQRSWQTEVGVVDQFIAHYGAGAVAIGPELSLRDGIAAARWLLEQPVRIHPRCDEHQGIEALREYRREWDEETRSFSTRPLHNWASHTADAWRYAACVVKASDAITRPSRPEPPPPPARGLATLTMDELWDCQPARPGSGRV